MKFNYSMTSLILLTTSGASVANGYDTETHALITRKAFAQSSIVQSDQFRQTLGLNRLDIEHPFDAFWLDTREAVYFAGGDSPGWTPGGITDAPQRLGWAEDFERCQMNEFLNIISVPNDPRQEFKSLFSDTVADAGDYSVLSFNDPRVPLQNWLVRGAIREDDMGDVTPLFPEHPILRKIFAHHL